MEVTNRKMSGDWQIGNQGKMGFFPTSQKIVEMELNLIDWSELNGNHKLNICDLSAGEGDSLDSVHQFFNKIKIENSIYLNEFSFERFEKAKEKYPYMHCLNSDIFFMKAGSKINGNRGFNKKVFNIIRNNPPYMDIERNGVNMRAELAFFIQNTLFAADGSITFLEVPLHQLIGIKGFLKKISYSYEFEVAKFPRWKFNDFKQVCVFCKKKKIQGYDFEKINSILSNPDNIPYMEDLTQPLMKYTVNNHTNIEISIFRENKITETTLFNGLLECLDDLIISDKNDTNKYYNKTKEKKPIIELMPGHISQLLAAGGYDGVLGDLLIKGGSNKKIKTEVIEEVGKTTTIQTEVLEPFLEITNKVGDIYYKNFSKDDN